MTKTLYYSVEKSLLKNDEDNYWLSIEHEEGKGIVIAKYNVKMDRLIINDAVNNLGYLNLIFRFIEEANRKESKTNKEG